MYYYCGPRCRGRRSYVIQGNVRFVGVQSSSSNSNSKGGRMDARAVLRLLVRSDNKEAVLFMDKIYFSSNPDATLEQQVRGLSSHTGTIR